MGRLTQNNKGKGWGLKLDNPQTDVEARTQLMEKFKLACEKLAAFEDFMEEHHFGCVENLKSFVETQRSLRKELAESKKALEAKESVNQAYKATLSLKDSDFSDLVRENAKLKQQLAEKEKEIEDAEITRHMMCGDYTWTEMVTKLMKEVEEKDKELNRYAELFGMKDKDFYVVEKTEYDKMKQGVKDIIQQSKTEFAIQQLERVKEFCENWKCYKENFNYVIVEEKTGIRCVSTLYEEIDQIIEELKGGAK